MKPDARRAEISVEGWSLANQVIDLSGDGVRDGLKVGSVMAAVLGVPPPAV